MSEEHGEVLTYTFAGKKVTKLFKGSDFLDIHFDDGSSVKATAAVDVSLDSTGNLRMVPQMNHTINAVYKFPCVIAGTEILL